jgi:hypothetical protein
MISKSEFLGIAAIVSVSVIYTGLIVYVFDKIINRFELWKKSRKNQ